ncbi:MAG: TMEM175 family protein [Alphaproteobacteria bacterium]
MGKGRLEAFSDGVIAIIITIMVLELKVPHGHELRDLLPMAPIFGAHVLSFLYVAIYWNNHHHLFQAVHKVNGQVLWANMHLLFWLSLIPFMSGWLGEGGFKTMPIVFYGVVLLMAGVAYYFLVHALIAHHGHDSKIAVAIGADYKGTVSLVVYAAGIAIAFFAPIAAFLLYAAVALVWFIPDKRIERVVS